MGREAKFKQLRKFYRARAKEAALAGVKLPGDMKSFVDSFMRPAKYARTIAVLSKPKRKAAWMEKQEEKAKDVVIEVDKIPGTNLDQIVVMGGAPIIKSEFP